MLFHWVGSRDFHGSSCTETERQAASTWKFIILLPFWRRDGVTWSPSILNFSLRRNHLTFLKLIMRQNLSPILTPPGRSLTWIVRSKVLNNLQPHSFLLHKDRCHKLLGARHSAPLKEGTKSPSSLVPPAAPFWLLFVEICTDKGFWRIVHWNRIFDQGIYSKRVSVHHKS